MVRKLDQAVIERREIDVQGIVQGVGFRPFIYSLAHRHGLGGWVRNDADGVHIEAEGFARQLDLFVKSIVTDAPPLAVIEDISWRPCIALFERDFRIDLSKVGEHRSALISPDVAVCADCLREMFNVTDRRYRYPFINCTNCGPRFTITQDIPYDRAATTMSGFAMCDACTCEYTDPQNRRFHAQPNACPECGPSIRLIDSRGESIEGEDVIQRSANLLRSGLVLAVKGLGGYHLACNPFDDSAVEALRSRKVRQDKPFALMALDVDQARTLCRFGDEEERLLTSAARPIVLMDVREDCGVARETAPRQKQLGVMLAYTPLHYLLLGETGFPLVMTSGNRSDEPIAYRDDEAITQLGGIADAFLTHNRPIVVRCDDSVMSVMDAKAYPVRRSRGMAPMPLRVAGRFERHTLACGGELKNTFCLAKENHAFLSHHIGDLQNYETLRSFRDGIAQFSNLFDVQPELVAYDLHPDYLSTKYARELEDAGVPAIGVQHHHAHIASCIADNGVPFNRTLIGVALDGTGYGTDETIWGGEFFAGSVDDGFTRRGRLEPMPLPGGDAATRQPWRMGIAQLIRLYGEEETLGLPLDIVRRATERGVRQIARLLEHRMNTPLTSSAGRLFDAVAAIADVAGTLRCSYEGQAAIELELAATPPLDSPVTLPFHLATDGDLFTVSTRELLSEVASEMRKGSAVGEISTRFHWTMAEIVAAGCRRISDASPCRVNEVALSGGVFQNRLLVYYAQSLLKDAGFTVYIHHRVPTNDGGLSLGQAVLADRQFCFQQKG